MINIYKFHEKETLIQPPGEPREQNLGDIKQKSLSYTKFHILVRPTSSGFKISQLETLKLLEVLVMLYLLFILPFIPSILHALIEEKNRRAF